MEGAEVFGTLWAGGAYAFSHGTEGQNSTPFLEAVIDQMRLMRDGKSLKVIEGGAGAGYHSIRLAQEHGVDVTAVEYVPDAVQLIRDNLDGVKLGEGSSLNIEQGELLAYLKGQPPNSCDIFYANSLLHLFTEDARKAVLNELSHIQPEGGIVAVSFKAEGDVLQSKGQVVERKPYGVIVEADYGAKRLFVTDPYKLMPEFEAAGYKVLGLHTWDVLGYNIHGEHSKFVGFLAQKTSPGGR